MSLDPSINSSGLNIPSSTYFDPIMQVQAAEDPMSRQANIVTEAVSRSLTNLPSPPENPANPPNNPPRNPPIVITQDVFDFLAQRVNALGSAASSLADLKDKNSKRLNEITDLQKENQKLKTMLGIGAGVAVLSLGFLVAPYAAPFVAPVVAKGTAAKLIVTTAIIL